MCEPLRSLAVATPSPCSQFHTAKVPHIETAPSQLLEGGGAPGWQHKYDKAREDFLTVLRLDPNNLSALNGLGYSFAWAAEYDEAEERFRQALAVAPGQLEASKGLAYVALWRGDAKEALRRFEAVVAQAPRDAEAQVGLGQAYLATGQRWPARKAFERAQQIEPGRKDAREGLEATRLWNPVAEATVWGGNTWFEKKGSREAELRFAEFAAWPAPSVRVWFQLDNGLSLDNLRLVQAKPSSKTRRAMWDQTRKRCGSVRVPSVYTDTGVRNVRLNGRLVLGICYNIS